jgi:hypothetical protein
MVSEDCHSLSVKDDPNVVRADPGSNQVLSYVSDPTSGEYISAGNFGAGARPFSVIQGSLDGSGAVDDVITVNRAATMGMPGSVSVLRGNGGGTFQALQNFTVGMAPNSVAVGDFNSDGIPDLVTANDTPGGTVSVLLGNGDGSFQPGRTFAAGLNPLSVVVGDFNGDGIPDLAVLDFGDSQGNGSGVSLLLGNGDGSFRPARTYAAGPYPHDVAIGDFNGDGFPDLAVTNPNSNTVSVLLANGDGSFKPARSYAAGAFPDSVAVGDFNRDGVPDLVTGNGNNGRVSVLLGNGDGSFKPAVTYATGGLYPVAVAVGDFNGDGIADLATVNDNSASDYSVGVLLGNGDGSFQPAHTYAIPALQSRAVVVGDFNGDGKADLAIVNYGRPPDFQGSVSVLLGNGDGTFQPVVTYVTGEGSQAVAVGDFNGDGSPDVAVANQASNNVSVLLGNGDGTFSEPPSYPVGRDPTAAVLGDFNGDGIPDLAVTNSSDNTVSVLLGNGDGTFQPAHTFAVGSYPIDLAVGDFDGDGTLDIVTANKGSNNVSVLLGNGDGTFKLQQRFDAGNSPSGIAVEDFNGDGLPDLAVSLQGQEAVAILFNQGGWGTGLNAPRDSGRGGRDGAAHGLSLDAFVQTFRGRQPWENRLVPGQDQVALDETRWNSFSLGFAKATGPWETTEAPAMNGTRNHQLAHPGFPGPARTLAGRIADLMIREWLTLGLAIPGTETDQS